MAGADAAVEGKKGVEAQLLPGFASSKCTWCVVHWVGRGVCCGTPDVGVTVLCVRLFTLVFLLHPSASFEVF